MNTRCGMFILSRVSNHLDSWSEVWFLYAPVDICIYCTLFQKFFGLEHESLQFESAFALLLLSWKKLLRCQQDELIRSASLHGGKESPWTGHVRSGGPESPFLSCPEYEGLNHILPRNLSPAHGQAGNRPPIRLRFSPGPSARNRPQSHAYSCLAQLLVGKQEKGARSHGRGARSHACGHARPEIYLLASKLLLFANGPNSAGIVRVAPGPTLYRIVLVTLNWIAVVQDVLVVW